MNFSSLLGELANVTKSNQSGIAGSGEQGGVVKGLTKNMPGGLAGGAVAGGLVAVLLGSKSARKTAGKVAKYGGAAALGGLAYKAYKDWQHTSQSAQTNQTSQMNYVSQTDQAPQTVQASQPAPSYSASRFQSDFEREALEHASGASSNQGFELNLVKAMVASARADGQIDADEQRRIAEAVNKLDLDVNAKSELLNLFLQPISIPEITQGLVSLEQKAEVYLASCLVIDLDHRAEFEHLASLSRALELPEGLERHLRAQAQNVKEAVA